VIRHEQLGNLAEFINGVAFKPEDWGEQGHRIIRIQNLTDPQKPYNRTCRPVEPRYQVHPGDLLVSWSASLGVYQWSGPDVGLLNQHIFRVVPHKDVVDKRYLQYALADALLAMQRHLHGATMQHVNRGEFLATQVPLPPMPQQRRIAAILDKAEALRAKRRLSLGVIERVIESTFLDLIARKDEYSALQIGEITEVQGGLQLTHTRASLPVEVPYLRVANVYRNRLDLVEVKSLRVTNSEIDRTRLLPGDLLVVEGHGNPEEIGRCAVWDGSIETCVHQNHLIRVRCNRTVMEPAFLSRYLNSMQGRKYLLRAGKTTSGLNTINVSEVRAVPVPVPPIELQRRFAEQLSSIGRKERLARTSQIKLDSLFASLQYRAFRGEL
jgi:type I restriction enzyme S subunit